MSHSGSTTVHIAAPPDKIWALISDITRMGDWSPETIKAEWIDGATGPVAGARFKGTNKIGPIRWSTKPVVEVAEPGKEFTFATGPKGEADTRWSYTLVPSGDGTDVTESWTELKPFPIPVIRSFMMNERRVKSLNAGCAKTLARIKAAAEA
jgi:carbon monoxide dehydrogenase subunit G